MTFLMFCLSLETKTSPPSLSSTTECKQITVVMKTETGLNNNHFIQVELSPWGLLPHLYIQDMYACFKATNQPLRFAPVFLAAVRLREISKLDLLPSVHSLLIRCVPWAPPYILLPVAASPRGRPCYQTHNNGGWTLLLNLKSKDTAVASAWSALLFGVSRCIMQIYPHVLDTSLCFLVCLFFLPHSNLNVSVFLTWEFDCCYSFELYPLSTHSLQSKCVFVRAHSCCM